MKRSSSETISRGLKAGIGASGVEFRAIELF
jgi:hypothetical protein